MQLVQGRSLCFLPSLPGVTQQLCASGLRGAKALRQHPRKMSQRLSSKPGHSSGFSRDRNQKKNQNQEQWLFSEVVSGTRSITLVHLAVGHSKSPSSSYR